MHRRPTPKQYPSDFSGGKPVLSTGYLVSCSRTQRSASGEARTRNPSISGQALYHDCAPQLGSILCRYDTCPTQYAPDLRGSILCMQGTQYAPRESILCMEHFVALQCPDWQYMYKMCPGRIVKKQIFKTHKSQNSQPIDQEYIADTCKTDNQILHLCILLTI